MPPSGGPSVRSGDILGDLPTALATESLQEILSGGAFRLLRIVSTGHATPEEQWYDQDDHEWVVLLSGSARVQIEHEAEPRPLRPGQWLFLPAGCRHRVESTSPTETTVWLALHTTHLDLGRAL